MIKISQNCKKQLVEFWFDPCNFQLHSPPKLMTVDSSQRLSSELTRLNWGLRKYDRLRATVIFATARVVQGRKFLSKEPFKLRFKTKTSCAAQHSFALPVKTKSLLWTITRLSSPNPRPPVQFLQIFFTNLWMNSPKASIPRILVIFQKYFSKPNSFSN